MRRSLPCALLIHLLFAVTAPELIAGITARVGKDDALPEYDGAVVLKAALTNFTKEMTDNETGDNANLG